MAGIQIIDTTLRDGQMSLWALGMRTGMMLSALPDMDEAGFEAMEFFVPSAQMKKMIRDLREDPLQWLKLGAAGVRKTPLRLHGGYIVLSKIPRSVINLLNEKAVALGITTTRTSHQWNDFGEMKEEVETFRKLGLKTVVNLTYTVSPRHTDEYFVARAKDAAAMNPYRICFKDVGGLLKPDRLRELLPKVQKAVGDITLEFHNHCNNGLGPLIILEAVKLGITHIHTAIPPLANGSSQPSVFNVVNNLKVLGYSPEVNLSVLKSVEKHFANIAKRENLPIGMQREYDESMYHHQIPGGMVSTLSFQLEKIGLGQRLEETLEEAARVREDLGYPIMITPLAQFVGTQAALNVFFGERYKTVADEVIQYALGHWGREAMVVMDQDVRAKILDRPRAREIADWPSSTELSLQEVRKRYGENLSDEELILRTFVDEEALTIASQAPKPVPYLSAEQPLVHLVKELVRIKDRGFITVKRGDFSLQLSKSNALAAGTQED